MCTPQMIEYYAQRAAEYERIYAKPERQDDLQSIAQFLSGAFAGDTVLEVACGTGYWTQVIARSASAIVATDGCAEVIERARQKEYGSCRVQFAVEDAFQLDGRHGCLSAGFHGFWWSHLPVAKIPGFLTAFHARLAAGAKVVMIDNRFVAGSSTPVSRRDADGNTYQVRVLQDGSQHEVLKNFPTESDLVRQLSAHATDIRVRLLQYYWIVEYSARQGF